jgi:PhnB protein
LGIYLSGLVEAVSFIYIGSLKSTVMARTSTYLNFPRQTEEAFNFYSKVFGSEFSGGGIMRFRDTPQPEGAPPMAEADKDLVMHVELPITGGHILMGTDAPESMGFQVTFGNNQYIMVEPDDKVEADRLFQELSVNGQIEMPMQDMFWGAYFGSFTDQFGLKWMVHFTYPQ